METTSSSIAAPAPEAPAVTTNPSRSRSLASLLTVVFASASILIEGAYDTLEWTTLVPYRGFWMSCFGGLLAIVCVVAFMMKGKISLVISAAILAYYIIYVVMPVL